MLVQSAVQVYMDVEILTYYWYVTLLCPGTLFSAMNSLEPIVSTDFAGVE